LLAAAGCASGGKSGLGADASDPPPPPIDSNQSVDALLPDAFVPPDGSIPDAFVPPPDAFVPDAFVCTPVTTQILLNPAFDLAPMGTNWVQTALPGYSPPITDEVSGSQSMPFQTPPYRVWLGGVEADLFTVTDALYQEVVIPANTTQLTLTGYVRVGTAETSTISQYDTASLTLTQTNGTVIANIASYSNLTSIPAWTPFAYTYTGTMDLSGQTVRLRMTSTNDFSNVTSFWFDTFALNATHCP
jgi:hypothetical protein